MMCRLLIVLCLVLPSVAKACTFCQCYRGESFDLMQYDRAEIIVEVEILAELPDDNSETDADNASSKATYTKDTLNWNKPYPPPPPPPMVKPMYRYEEDFKIKVIAFYKGVKRKVEILRNYTGCSSYPFKVGEKYIVYSEEVGVKGNVMFVGGCPEVIELSNKTYKTAKKNLKILRKARNGQFEIYGEVLIDNQKKRALILEGTFQNKIRQGIWTMYEPIYYSRHKTRGLNAVLDLTYKDGKLINQKYSPPMDSFIKNSFTLMWWWYYDTEIDENKEK